MEYFTTIVSIIGIIGTISSIFFAYLAFRKNEIKDEHAEGQHEGAILSDIGYIKACVDRVEKNLTKVDERYRNILERLSKVEESVVNINKRIENL